MDHPRRSDLPKQLAKRERLQREAMRFLERLFPGAGLVLLTFDFGGKGHMSYISNADHEDMIKVLRDTADRLELRSADTAGRGEA